MLSCRFSLLLPSCNRAAVIRRGYRCGRARAAAVSSTMAAAPANGAVAASELSAAAGAGAPAKTYAPVTEWDPEVQQFLEACLGVEQLQRISEALTRPPLATCIRVNTLRTAAEELLARLPEALSPEDRALLDANPAKPYIHPQVPEAIIVPGTGPHEIDYSCTGGKEVIVGRLAGEAMLRGAHLFAPGLLAVSAGISRGDLVAVAVGVEVSGTESTRKDWGMTKGTVLGVDPEKDAQLPDRSRLYIGVGRAEMSRVEMFREGSGLAVSMVERVFRTPGCGGILKGQLMLQNLPSLLVAHVLAPAPGSRVLDMCAAPGGKTTAIAQLMRNQGEVIAFDRSHAKAREIRQLAEELGLTCVKAYKMDASRAVLRQQPSVAAADSSAASGSEREPSSAGESTSRDEGDSGAAPAAGQQQQQQLSERMQRRVERISAARQRRGLGPGVFTASGSFLPEGEEATVEGYPPESFDAVLLDAPCSALGLRPRLVHRQSMAELRGTAAYQRKLLDTAVQLVKPGGTLVFSTCSINPGENEANVRWVLEQFPFMRLAPQEPRLGGPGLSGVVPLPGGGRLRLLSPEQAALVQRFDPSAPLDTPGFFIAKFVKAESCLPQARPPAAE